MPLVGTRELAAFDSGPLASALQTERLDLESCAILQIMYEIDAEAVTSLLPPALHPTVPPTIIFTFTKVPDSPAGPFVLAEAKIGARSGARPRGLSLGAFCSTAEAANFLTQRWGYPVKQAEVTLTKRYDRVVGSVEAGGKKVLDATLLNPEPIAGNDILYLAILNVAKIQRDGATISRLIQVDPDYVFRSADRGKPELHAFDADAFNLNGARPAHAVSASYAVADIQMPEVRYLVDPAKPPLMAVEKL
jgi:acetoacetate decarboxylase